MITWTVVVILAAGAGGFVLAGFTSSADATRAANFITGAIAGSTTLVVQVT